jgi:hypothetical protein
MDRGLAPDHTSFRPLRIDRVYDKPGTVTIAGHPAAGWERARGAANLDQKILLDLQPEGRVPVWRQGSGPSGTKRSGWTRWPLSRRTDGSPLSPVWRPRSRWKDCCRAENGSTSALVIPRRVLRWEVRTQATCRLGSEYVRSCPMRSRLVRARSQVGTAGGSPKVAKYDGSRNEVTSRIRAPCIVNTSIDHGRKSEVVASHR